MMLFKGEPMVWMLGGYSIRHVFTDVHELLLRKYILRVSTFYIGLTLIEIRTLAHVYAVKHEHNIPMSWAEHHLSRHPLLSLTIPEAPNLIHIRSLNQHNIECFRQYTGLMTRTSSPPKPKHIWNCYESGNRR